MNKPNQTQRKIIHIEIQKADGMQGFAAYFVSPARSKKKVVLLNVYATLLSAVEEGISPKELMLEHLMHEFGHAMQDFLGMKVTEKNIEKYIKSYIEKYHEKGYVEQHGEQNL